MIVTLAAFVTLVRGRLLYNQGTGVFVWLTRVNGRVPAGAVAGNVRKDGYVHIGIDGRFYMAHRLAWLHAYGAWPRHEIDHRNGIRNDNRIVNLREATRSQNRQNLTAYRNSSSSYPGVCWARRERKWMAQIQVNGRKIHLGKYATEEEAYAAYCEAKKQAHPFQPVPREARA